jgi:hypothetical protein
MRLGSYAQSKVDMYYMEFQLLQVLSVNNIPQILHFPMSIDFINRYTLCAHMPLA